MQPINHHYLYCLCDVITRLLRIDFRDSEGIFAASDTLLRIHPLLKDLGNIKKILYISRKSIIAKQSSRDFLHVNTTHTLKLLPTAHNQSAEIKMGRRRLGIAWLIRFSQFIWFLPFQATFLLWMAVFHKGDTEGIYHIRPSRISIQKLLNIILLFFWKSRWYFRAPTVDR